MSIGSHKRESTNGEDTQYGNGGAACKRQWVLIRLPLGGAMALTALAGVAFKAKCGITRACT